MDACPEVTALAELTELEVKLVEGGGVVVVLGVVGRPVLVVMAPEVDFGYGTEVVVRLDNVVAG